MKNILSITRTALVLGFALLAGGNLFANDADAETIKTAFPKNTITIDIWHTGYYLFQLSVMHLILPDSQPISFGIATQYERQLMDKISVGLRFEYGISSISGTTIILDEVYNSKVSAFSAQGHGRFYPWAKTFFLDVMLGYAAIWADGSSASGSRKKFASDYYQLGASLGWRIDFNKPGGLVLEPALGYTLALGNDLFPVNADDSYSDVPIERSLLIGGFKLYIGLGYRF